MPLKILSSDDYRGSAPGAVVTDGALAHTHIALLVTEPGTRPTRCYVKLYPDFVDGLPHRGLANEIIGHVLATLMGLPVPRRAGLIGLNPNQLVNLPSWSLSSNPYPAWWIEDAVAPSLKGFYKIDASLPLPIIQKKLASIKAELLKCPDIKKMIAFDDIIANIDRNVGNLLRIKASDYLLIDHGLCLGSETWTADSLDPEEEFENRLRDLIGAEAGYLPFRHAIVSAHEHLTKNIETLIAALLEWLLWAVDPSDAEAVGRFIRHRAAPGAIAQRMELFI